MYCFVKSQSRFENSSSRFPRISLRDSVDATEGMRPKKKTMGEGDLFRARLDQIVNLKHQLGPVVI